MYVRLYVYVVQVFTRVARKSVTCAGVVLYGTRRTKEDHTIFAAVGTGYSPLLSADTAAVANSPFLFLSLSSPCVGGRGHPLYWIAKGFGRAGADDSLTSVVFFF
jgi:hypothetical protein